MQAHHRYRHFCPMAQALERLGERWGLLIVRDLLPGPLRFTDLLRTCGGIIPRQLSARLRQLEADGIVEVDRASGRREVWYRLTPAGEALRPAVEAMLLWGVHHIARPPSADEPIQPNHILNGTRLAVAEAPVQPRAPVSWAWRFPGEPYTLHFDGHAWDLAPGEDAEAAVVVETTPRAWADFIADRRRTPETGSIRIQGRSNRVAEFTAMFPRLADSGA